MSRVRLGSCLFSLLFATVACLVFVALGGAMILSGQVPLYAPRVIACEPGPGYPFRPTTPLTLTFDQPMDPASVEAAFSLEPPAQGQLRWNADRTRLTFVPTGPGYETDSVQTVRLAAGARAGTLPRRMAQSWQGQFALPPLVEALTPSAPQKDAGPWPTLQATFNYPLDCQATLSTFTITPEAAGRLTCDGHTLTFSPTLPLLPGTAYTARLGNIFLAGDGWARPGVRWEIETATPLIVISASPAPGTSLTDLWTPVRITFNRPVLPESAVERLTLAPEGGEPLTGQVIWQDNGSTLLFRPEKPLAPDTPYHLTLQAGVHDRLGFKLDQALTLFFATAPMLAQVSPADKAQGVLLDETIRIPFTRPMDQASVEAGLAFSPTLDGKVTWEGNTLTFTPRTGLLPNTQYQVLLGAEVRDRSGAPLAMSYLWSFTTQPFLLGARPTPARELLDLQTPVEFTFALPMDRASIRAALTISPTTPGHLLWSDGDRTIAFQPDPAWQPGTAYQVTLSGKARTANGWQMLGQDYPLRFTTGVAEVQFGEGPNIQVVDAAGERAFQFLTRGADLADFRLYPITPTQFLDLYSSGFRGIGPQEPQIVDTTGLTPTVQWYEAPTPLEGQSYYYENWRAAQAHIPADVPPGLYILSAEPPAEVQGQLLVVLTRHALMLKRTLIGTGSRAQAQIVAWDTELSSGAPVVSATLRLYDRDGTFLAEGQTDADGLLTLEVPGDPGPLLALSDRDGDVTACGFSNEWSQAGWWGWWTQPASRPLYTTYSYTDRPIYRPGQTIYFKDFVRADDDVSYTLPAPDLPVTVRLRDARDNVVATQVLTPTQFGTVHGAFHLADETMLGTWHLETEVEGTLARQPLQVEEYRKPEYEVTVHIPQKACVAGERISVTVEAAYYFGQPVAGANASLLVYANFDEDSPYDDEERPYLGYPILERQGQTDAQGRWHVVVPTADLFQSGGRRAVLAVEATVADESGQSVSSYQTVVVQRTSQGISLLLEQHGYEPNEEIAFIATVRDRDNRPVAGAELTAQVLGWDEREVARAEATTDDAGNAGFSLRLTEQGWYHLAVQGTDEGGRQMLAEEWLWVYDPGGQAPWYRGQSGTEPTLAVSADRETYAVGDVARLMVYAQGAGPALLTFERGETHGARPVTLLSGTNLITVPVLADYAPNIYVMVSRFGPPIAGDEGWGYGQTQPEAHLHTAGTQLLVPLADRRLTVTLTTDSQTYRPGDPVTFHVRVTDHAGQPAVAEVSLAVVDEAIYALAEERSGDPFEVFYAPRPNLVDTFDSLRPTRWLIPQGGMGGGGGEGGSAPRRTFLDTAHWAPTVVTDENGEATITFQLPDNLTEWRALARAVTTDTRVGQATARLVVSQEIILRPALPRFLVQGDAITLTATVHNFTAQPVSATVELNLSALRLLAPNLQKQVVHVPAGGSASVGWPVTAEEPGQAQVTVQATATYRGARLAGRDAVELPLPVYPRAIPEVATWAGDLTPSRPGGTVTITLPADVLEGLSRVEIHLAPTVAPGLLQGLEYLIDYPFG